MEIYQLRKQYFFLLLPHIEYVGNPLWLSYFLIWEVVFRLIYFKSNEVDKIELFSTFLPGVPSSIYWHFLTLPPLITQKKFCFIKSWISANIKCVYLISCICFSSDAWNWFSRCFCPFWLDLVVTGKISQISYSTNNGK